MSDPGYAATTNRRCERCGSPVSTGFVRVFGYDDAVHGCLECLTRTELAVGDAAHRSESETESGVRWNSDGDRS